MKLSTLTYIIMTAIQRMYLGFDVYTDGLHFYLVLLQPF